MLSDISEKNPRVCHRNRLKTEKASEKNVEREREREREREKEIEMCRLQHGLQD